jgi:hypothetical protein
LRINRFYSREKGGDRMATKKDLIIAVLITFCLTVSVFMVLPSKSSGGQVYNPWADIDGNGTVDLKDLVLLAQSYGTSGTPINRAQILNNTEYSGYVAAYQNLRDEINNRVGWLAKDLESFITPTDPLVNATVYSITGGWSNRSDWNEYWNDIKAIWNWVRSNIQYRADGLYPILPADPSGSVTFTEDMWQLPNETLNIRKGDCEDQAMLLCSMLRCLNYKQYWIECVWINSQSGSHVGVQIPVSGNQLTILDPAGNYYTSDFWGNIINVNVTKAINDWLSYTQSNVGMSSDVYVYRVFSDYVDKMFASTNDYLAWMYSR